MSDGKKITVRDQKLRTKGCRSIGDISSAASVSIGFDFRSKFSSGAQASLVLMKHEQGIIDVIRCYMKLEITDIGPSVKVCNLTLLKLQI